MYNVYGTIKCKGGIEARDMVFEGVNETIAELFSDDETYCNHKALDKDDAFVLDIELDNADEDIITLMDAITPYADQLEDVNMVVWGTDSVGEYFKVVLKDRRFLVYDGYLAFNDIPISNYAF